MAAALHIVDIITAIKALTISGLTIYGLDDLPEQVDARSDVSMFPDPFGYITNLTIANVTFGAHDAAKDARYRINYVFAVKSTQAGRGLYEYIQPTAEIAQDIIEILTTSDLTAAGAVETTVSCPFIGQVEDPAGNKFHGGKIAVDILDFVQ